MRNCNDPLIYNDPNNSCRFGIDLKNDGPVDMNDMQIMPGNWTEGVKE
jgi:hypothetical protein